MSSPAYTLADLLDAEDVDTIRARLLGGIHGAGFPALTEWVQKRGVEMDFVDMVARSLDELIAADRPAIVGGGFLGRAAGVWMDLKAGAEYFLERVGATKTSFNYDLVVADTGGPYDWDVGDIELVSTATGNRYRSTTAASAAGGDTVTIGFEAEEAGAAFTDDPLVVGFELVTKFAGVTLQVSQPVVSPVTHIGVSTGQLRPTAEVGADAHTVTIRIDTPGDVGVATFSVDVDGAGFTGGGVLLASVLIGDDPALGSTLQPLNGAETPTSFLEGDTFTYAVPGGPSYVQGSDDETDEEVADRCRGRWPSLSLNGTTEMFALWAKTTCPTASRIHVRPDRAGDVGAVPGRVRMAVADSHGSMDAASLARITAFIVPKLSVLDGVLVEAAVQRSITAAGGVLVDPTRAAVVQQAAESAWILYLGQVEIGTGTVKLAKLEEILMDAGAIDVGVVGGALTLNGSAGNVRLADGEVPVASGTLIDQLTWVFA